MNTVRIVRAKAALPDGGMDVHVRRNPWGSTDMQDSENSAVLSGTERATVFREFDDLWEMPSTPERRARMEALLKLLEPKQADDATDIAA
jgi:hypothetical protein